MNYNNDTQGVAIKQPSQMDTLLSELDNQISRNYVATNAIRSSRLTVQGTVPSNSKEGNECKPQRFQEGILARLDSLIDRLTQNNNELETEAKILSDYL